MGCDMCGKETEQLYNARIEGTVMKVCGDCAKYDPKATPEKSQIKFKTKKKQISNNQTRNNNSIRSNFAPEEETEVIQVIVKNYGQKIRTAREKKGMKQSQLAQKIAEKESLIHSLESEKHEPNQNLARKLERFLNIKLTEERKLEKTSTVKSRTGPITIADLIKK